MTYQTASQYLSSPAYRKYSSIPEYFDDNNQETVIGKEDPFEKPDMEPEEVDEFLEDSDPFYNTEIDPFKVLDVDPFLIDERDMFDEIDEFNEDDTDPFVVDDVDLFNANQSIDENLNADPFLAEVCYSNEPVSIEEQDPFLIEDETTTETTNHSRQSIEPLGLESNLYLQILGFICLIIVLVVVIMRN